MRKLLIILVTTVLLCSASCASMPKMYAGLVGQAGLHKGAVAADVGDGLADVLDGGTMAAVVAHRLVLFGYPVGFSVLYGEQEKAHTELRVVLGGRIF